jgi:hypothetical protein
VAYRLRGKTVQEVGGSVQGLCPVAGRERRLEEEAAEHISGGGGGCARPAVGASWGRSAMGRERGGGQQGAAAKGERVSRRWCAQGAARAAEAARAAASRSGGAWAAARAGREERER